MFNISPIIELFSFAYLCQLCSKIDDTFQNNPGFNTQNFVKSNRFFLLSDVTV